MLVEAIDALKNLTGNDLSDLINQRSKIQYMSIMSSAHLKNDNPDHDLLTVMNGLMALLGKHLGWKSVEETVKSSCFMYDISRLSYKELTPEMTKQAEEIAKQCNLKQLKIKSKAAHAFALWLTAVTNCALNYQLERNTKLRKVSDEIKEETKKYEAFSIKIKTQYHQTIKLSRGQNENN